MGIRLVVKSRDVEYSIELFRKYTIVQGESGTGKTTLVQRIVQFNQGISKFGAVSVQCELEVNAMGTAFRDAEDFETFLKKNDGVIVLDEFVMGSIRFNSADVAKLLKKYDRYYILISREGELFKSVPVAIDDLVEIKGSGKYHTFQKVYELSPVVQETVNVGCIITEDKKSSYLFMENYFKGVLLDTGDGKDGICKAIYKNKNKGKLFIMYDSLSAGYVEDGIRKTCKQLKLSAILFHPLCFEKYLLDSPFLAGHWEEIHPPLDALEEWYERELSRILPHGYKKGALPVCITMDCAAVKKSGYAKCTGCKLCDFTETKRNLVVYGTLAKVRGL